MTRKPISFVDTHAHLDDAAFAKDRDDVIAAAIAAGVTRIINIGYRPAIWQASIDLAAAHEGISYTLGIHPNHAADATPEALLELRDLVARTHPVAIGEVGLDYYRDWADADTQRAAFRAQIEIARDAGLPLVIHQRSAEDEFLTELEHIPDAITVVLHSFDGTGRLLDAAIEHDCPIGVGGLMTRATSESLRILIGRVPDHLLLLETDSPYLKPAGVRGTRNTPATIPNIAAALADLRGQSVDEIAALTSANAERVFALAPAPIVAMP